MTQNYKYTKHDRDDFYVTEEATGNIIAQNLLHKDASKLIKHLNDGGGFDGFTPDFFLRDIKYET
jgi:hypothetical protein